jgi:PAS domain S-box-containing protein
LWGIGKPMANELVDAHDQGVDASRTPKILVVDSRAANREYLAQFLDRKKYRIMEAADGAEALCLLRSKHADLVITDIVMPNKTGPELVRALRADPDLADIPVIFLSGRIDEREALALARSCSVSHAVAKPAAPRLIFDVIESCLNGKGAGTALPRRFDPDDSAESRARELAEVNRRLDRFVAALANSDKRLFGTPSNTTSGAAAGRSLDRGLKAANAPDSENSVLDHSSRLRDCIAELSSMALVPMATDKLFDVSARLVGEALRADYCRVLEIPRAGKLTQVVVYHSPVGADRSRVPDPPPNSLAAFAASVATPVLVGRLDKETRFAGKPLFDHFSLSSAIGVAIGSSGNRFAILEIFSRNEGWFDAEHVRFVQTGVNIIAAAIERTRAVENLRSSQSHLTHLISSSPSVIYALNVKGDSLYPGTVGENIVRITGYSVREALRVEWWQEHAHPEELILEIANGTAARTGNPFVREYQFTRADGKTIWLRDESRIIVGNPGAPLQIVGSLSDVTEQRALEEQFRRAQKMETFGQLAGGITHDFNNLLTVISGFTQFELAETDLAPRTRNALETVSKAADGAIALTRQLVAFSRRQVLSRQVVDLGTVTENLVKMLRTVIGADINLRTDVRPGLPSVDVDPGMMEQILLNLAVNARDAMPQGGNLNIAIYPYIWGDTDVRPGSDRRPGEFVCLEVRDTGSGMSEDTVSHLFEPFFTTKDAGKGTGLGLATVHGIVQQHKGWVEVESQYGRGSAFRIFLPAAGRTADEAAETVVLPNMPDSDSTILLVEDNELVRSFTEMFLRHRGYKVLTADCGAAAEAILTHPDVRVDLLLTDIVLPGGMSGLELAEKIGPYRPGLSVLYTSGYYADPDGKAPRLEEGLNFVRKPFELARLAAAVGNCLARTSSSANKAA